MSDWEYSEEGCPKCSEQIARARCNDCEEGAWYFEDCNGVEVNPCDLCFGRGYHQWCRACGWDNVFQEFLNSKYEQEWLDKQPAE